MATVSLEQNAPAAQPAKAAEPLFSPRDFSMAMALVVIWIYFAFAAPAFLSSRNLSNLAVELSITAVLSLGLLLIILTGNIDLSVGSGLGLIGGISAVMVTERNFPAPVALIAGLILGVAIWLGMGKLIVGQRIPAFIVTLAGLLVFRGLQWKAIHNATIPVSRGGEDNLYSLLTTWYLPPVGGLVLAAAALGVMVFLRVNERRRRIALGFPAEDGELTFLRTIVAGQVVFLFVLVCNQFQGIPLPALILAGTALLVWILTEHTRFGRYLYAVGGNEDAARLSGVPVDTVIITAFGIMGAFVALGGYLQTAYAGAATTTTGQLQELDAIAACVIGGASLKGGRGTVSGVLFGSLIMASLINGMTLMAVSPEANQIARGLVLALAVWVDARLSKGK